MKKIIFVFVVLFGQMFFGQEKEEVLKIEWPKEHEWKVENKEENSEVDVIEAVPLQEGKENRNIVFIYTRFKNLELYNVEFLKNFFIKAFKEDVLKGKITILGESKNGEREWVLYKVENVNYIEEDNQSAVLYYILQGDKNTHAISIEVKEKSLSAEFVKKWSKVFKEGRLVKE